MIRSRFRLLVALSRPAVILLLGLFTLAGAAQAGATDRPAATGIALVAVIGFLVFSVVINDLADEEIDQVNLPNDASRPLVVGTGTRQGFLLVGAVAGSIAVGAGFVVSWLAGLTVVGGLALSAAYSLRPVRIADRGALASLMLPLGYVGVPFLIGVFSVRNSVTRADLWLLVGLYLGFIGRIILKDFRDLKGDALFGKRTFLVRHGRTATCRVSATTWVAGSIVLASVRGVTMELVVSYAVFTGLALVLLRALSIAGGPRRDESLISAIALVGRGTMVTLIGHLTLVNAHWSSSSYRLAMLTFAFITVCQVVSMARRGPITRSTPAALGLIGIDEVSRSAMKVNPSPANILLDSPAEKCEMILQQILLRYELPPPGHRAIATRSA